MPKARIVGAIALLTTLCSCSSMPPVGVLRYRAKCCTEDRLLGKEMHLTAAEARAQVALHRQKHPGHVTTVFSTQPEPWDGK